MAVGVAVVSHGGCSGSQTKVRWRPPPADRSPLLAEQLYQDVLWMCAPERAGRGSFQDGGRLAASHIAEVFGDLGLEVVRQPIPGGASNIIGIQRGGPQAVLVSAHYDHLGIGPDGEVYPGADDNASGVAVLLGMARAAASREYEHTVLFVAFGAEEAGLVGSGVYIAEPTWPLDRTRAIINFDMVGRAFFDWGSSKPATVAVVGLEDDPALAAAAERAAASAGVALVAVPSRLIELFGFDDRTDDWWFRRRGIPAIHFSTSLHRDYHQVSDTPDKIIPAQLERVARTSMSLLGHLATERGGPTAAEDRPDH